jgi:hypothetical protein
MTRTRSISLPLAGLALCLAFASTLSGCVYYPATNTYGPYVEPGPSTFDRAFAAALGAFTDQKLTITTQDRGTGTIIGERGGVGVTATVRPQADGTTRVEFSPRGDQSEDPGIVKRVLASYNARMGR